MTVPAILVLGNVNLDLVLGEINGWPAIGTEIMVDRAETRAGGSAGNTALALTGLGVPHLLIASTGNDANGEWLRGRFDPATSYWIVDEGDTTLTVGIVHKGGDRAFFTTPGHLQRARFDQLEPRVPYAPHANSWAIISGGFLMPGLMQAGDALLDLLAARGWRTAIDPGWPLQGWTPAAVALVRGWLARADCALLNADEIMGITQIADLDTAVARLASSLAPHRILVVKDGANGAMARHAGEHFQAPSPKVTVIDTVGAGDTFNAAFLATLSAGAALGDALAAGTAIAAQAISTFPRRYTR